MQKQHQEAIVRKILSVAHELNQTGRTAASTGEQIAAAFVLNNMNYLPQGYTVIEAWERLEPSWQRLAKGIQQH